MSISRRALLAGAPVLLTPFPARAADDTGAARKLKVAIFSKHLQFVAGEELARTAADLGFDEIDITVRKGGHVAPERVRQDLPPLVALIRKRGLGVPMITTDIVDTETPFTEDILATMQGLGIRYYRWGGYKYAEHQPYEAQLEQMRPRMAKLAAWNARYRVCAMYHTHSGTGLVGASIWDLYVLLKDLDPNAVGVNYDVGHAVIEGGLGGWINSFHITGPHLRGIAVKDFLWARDARGNWREQWVPLGDGMVPFPKFFPMVAESGFQGPLQIHFEYPLKTPEEHFAAMKRDLGRLRGFLAQAGL
ncbi:MAG TPA: sugar phosphate isomerase/epimerase family protein [Bryobacteraceae bacterium]|nr:sugar phosphate isomerase/epimerase family protein [Bryobacteraceae bacterium]